MANCKKAPERPSLKEENGTLRAGPVDGEVNVKCAKFKQDLAQDWEATNNCQKSDGRILSGCVTTWKEEQDGEYNEYEFDLTSIDQGAIDQLVNDLKGQRDKLKNTGKDCPYGSSSTYRYSTKVWRPNNRSGSNPYSNGTWVTTWRNGSVNLNCCDSDYVRYNFEDIKTKTEPKEPDPKKEWTSVAKPGDTFSYGNASGETNSCGSDCINKNGGKTGGSYESGNPTENGSCPDKKQKVKISAEQKYTKKYCCNS